MIEIFFCVLRRESGILFFLGLVRDNLHLDANRG